MLAEYYLFIVKNICQFKKEEFVKIQILKT